MIMEFCLCAVIGDSFVVVKSQFLLKPLLNESPTRFSTSIFFHHSNPHRPLTNGLKYFDFG